MDAVGCCCAVASVAAMSRNRISEGERRPAVLRRLAFPDAGPVTISNGRLPHPLSHELEDQDSKDNRASDAGFVFMVLPVARRGVGTLLISVARKAWKHARNLAGIFVVGGEGLAQVTFFSSDD